MRSIVVGVTGLNAADNPGPGVGIARSLREDPDLDVTIVGLAYNALEPGLYMDWVVDHSFTLPYPSSGIEEFLSRLRYIHEEVGLDCVIPCLDAELPMFIRSAGELEAWGVRTFRPTMSQFRLRGKDRLPQLAEQAGLCVPRTAVVNGEADLWRDVDEIGLPLFVKGIYYDARKAVNATDVAVHYRRILAEWGGPVLLQEVVAGEELNVVGVGDGEGGHLGMVGARKTVVDELQPLCIVVGPHGRDDQPLAALQGGKLDCLLQAVDVHAQGAHRALKLAPANYYANLRLAYSLRMQERYTEAEAVNRQMLKLYPSDVTLLWEQALALTGRQQAEAAADLYRQIEVLTPAAAQATDAAAAP